MDAICGMLASFSLALIQKCSASCGTAITPATVNPIFIPCSVPPHVPRSTGHSTKHAMALGAVAVPSHSHGFGHRRECLVNLALAREGRPDIQARQFIALRVPGPHRNQPLNPAEQPATCLAFMRSAASAVVGKMSSER